MAGRRRFTLPAWRPERLVQPHRNCTRRLQRVYSAAAHGPQPPEWLHQYPAFTSYRMNLGVATVPTAVMNPQVFLVHRTALFTLASARRLHPGRLDLCHQAERGFSVLQPRAPRLNVSLAITCRWADGAASGRHAGRTPAHVVQQARRQAQCRRRRRAHGSFCAFLSGPARCDRTIARAPSISPSTRI